ncbi:MAG: hypothetical protein K6G65_10305 [Lachnospiraceae bacterium]|nr:hypothetical protein [Lachnospiraceae bacterium]
MKKTKQIISLCIAAVLFFSCTGIANAKEVVIGDRENFYIDSNITFEYFVDVYLEEGTKDAKALEQNNATMKKQLKTLQREAGKAYPYTRTAYECRDRSIFKEKMDPTKVYLADGGVIIPPVSYIKYSYNLSTEPDITNPYDFEHKVVPTSALYVKGKVTAQARKCKKICDKVQKRLKPYTKQKGTKQTIKIPLKKAKKLLNNKEKNYLKKYLYTLPKEQMKQVKKTYNYSWGKIYLLNDGRTWVMQYGLWTGLFEECETRYERTYSGDEFAYDFGDKYYTSYREFKYEKDSGIVRALDDQKFEEDDIYMPPLSGVDCTRIGMSIDDSDETVFKRSYKVHWYKSGGKFVKPTFLK